MYCTMTLCVKSYVFVCVCACVGLTQGAHLWSVMGGMLAMCEWAARLCGWESDREDQCVCVFANCSDIYSPTHHWNLQQKVECQSSGLL